MKESICVVCFKVGIKSKEYLNSSFDNLHSSSDNRQSVAHIEARSKPNMNIALLWVIDPI